VSRGHRLAVLEAMKMQHDILADVDGVISQIAARPGEQVVANDLLITIEQEVV
jgi:geranyl-CoA carboxylase alpha subunit